MALKIGFLPTFGDRCSLVLSVGAHILPIISPLGGITPCLQFTLNHAPVLRMQRDLDYRCALGDVRGASQRRDNRQFGGRHTARPRFTMLVRAKLEVERDITEGYSV